MRAISIDGIVDYIELGHSLWIIFAYQRTFEVKDFDPETGAGRIRVDETTGPLIIATARGMTKEQVEAIVEEQGPMGGAKCFAVEIFEMLEGLKKRYDFREQFDKALSSR